MRVKRDNDALHIALNAMEGRVLLRVFQHLGKMYRCKPEEIDPLIAPAWYSTSGCESALATPEEAREWVGHLHEFKIARLIHIEDWCRQLALLADTRSLLKVPLDDAPDFIGSINDHRLLAATEHNVGEEEMNLRTPAALAALPDARQAALFEIHFLAWIIEETLAEIQDL